MDHAVEERGDGALAEGGRPVLRDHDVRRLQVPVRGTGAVDGLQGLGEAGGERVQLRLGQPDPGPRFRAGREVGAP
ncbi:hypothetical protein ACFWFX_14330 [Streptomyces roseolus]|uniref:hypothetical protein n=1 Tax=Streptomyces roseolus TaxID=67358 RepID=UPI003645FFED